MLIFLMGIITRLWVILFHANISLFELQNILHKIQKKKQKQKSIYGFMHYNI